MAGCGLDLEDLAVRRAGRRALVTVVVDSDGGPSLDDVAEATRAVSEALDGDPDGAGLDGPALRLLDGPYTLEVTSPGVDRPLALPRHWHRAQSRLVRAVLRDGTDVTGRVRRVDGEAVVLDVGGSERTLDLGQVARATVQVEFSRKDDA